MNWYLSALKQWLSQQLSVDVADAIMVDYEAAVAAYDEKYNGASDDDDREEIWLIKADIGDHSNFQANLEARAEAACSLTEYLCAFVNSVSARRLATVGELDMAEPPLVQTMLPILETEIEEMEQLQYQVFYLLARNDGDPAIPVEFAEKLAGLAETNFVVMCEDPCYGSFWELGKQDGPGIRVQQHRDADGKITGYTKFVATAL